MEGELEQTTTKAISELISTDMLPLVLRYHPAIEDPGAEHTRGLKRRSGGWGGGGWWEEVLS